MISTNIWMSGRNLTRMKSNSKVESLDSSWKKMNLMRSSRINTKTWQHNQKITIKKSRMPRTKNKIIVVTIMMTTKTRMSQLFSRNYWKTIKDTRLKSFLSPTLKLKMSFFWIKGQNRESLRMTRARPIQKTKSSMKSSPFSAIFTWVTVTTTILKKIKTP